MFTIEMQSLILKRDVKLHNIYGGCYNMLLKEAIVINAMKSRGLCIVLKILFSVQLFLTMPTAIVLN